MPVDPETFEFYEKAFNLAKRRGLTLVETLDRADLLVTEARRHEIKVQGVEDMFRRLDRQSPNKLMSHYYGRVDGTPAEMFEAVKLWLEAVVRNLANKTLEDL